MDSQTFGSVMCGLGLFRERHKAASGKPAPHADEDAADVATHTAADGDDTAQDAHDDDDDDDDDDDTGEDASIDASAADDSDDGQ